MQAVLILDIEFTSISCLLFPLIGPELDKLNDSFQVTVKKTIKSFRLFFLWKCSVNLVPIISLSNIPDSTVSTAQIKKQLLMKCDSKSEVSATENCQLLMIDLIPNLLYRRKFNPYVCL